MRNRALSLSLICAALLAAAAPAFSSASLSAGQASPALKVEALSGSHFELAHEKGKVVIVIFFATWCDGCEKELKLLNDYLKKYRKNGLDILALSIERPGERKKLAEFMHPFDFPAALLSDAEVNDFARPAVLPTIYLIDRNGLIRFLITPEKTRTVEQSLESALNSLMPTLMK